MKINKEQKKYILDNCDKNDILEITNSKIVVKACNINNYDIFEGTYTVESLEWGEFRTVLDCPNCYNEKIFADFDEYNCGRPKKETKNRNIQL